MGTQCTAVAPLPMPYPPPCAVQVRARGGGQGLEEGHEPAQRAQASNLPVHGHGCQSRGAAALGSAKPQPLPGGGLTLQRFEAT